MNLYLAGRAALVVCLCSPFAAGCGGGGSAPAADAAGGAPIPGSPSPTGGGELQPEVLIERDPDGTAYIRVVEQTYNPLSASAPAKVIKDTTLGPAPGVNNIIANVQTAEVANVNVVRMKHGLMLANTGTVWINDYNFTQFDGGGQIWGAAIKLGDSANGSQAFTYIQHVFADGMQKPDGTYKVSNTDFIGIEGESGPVYVRDVTGRNFGDAAVDSKSSRIYIMNATFDGGHRMVRAWQNVEIILVNSIVNASPGHSQGAIFDTTGTVRYYNTLWCQDAHPATIESAKCGTTPWLVEGEDLPVTVAAARFIPLSSNPLPAISPFFKTSIDQIVVEASRDGGKTWTQLSMPNTGGPGTPPVGDPRYPIPLNLADAAYRFRAYYKRDGASVGQMSGVIGEDGKLIG
ncbi:MAG: hypothetical protein Q8R82_22415 [Hyphomonadaceae bacterium]|nr:hypothetical protein [Hyphomonadaceae bacterium]